MKLHPFGPLFPVSTLTLGGGGLGMLWGQTTFEECVATVHAAVAAGINLLDLAPRYGDGRRNAWWARRSVAVCLMGSYVTSKCNLGNPEPEQVYSRSASIHRDQPAAVAAGQARYFLPALEFGPGRTSDVERTGCQPPDFPVAVPLCMSGRRSSD